MKAVSVVILANISPNILKVLPHFLLKMLIDSLASHIFLERIHIRPVLIALSRPFCIDVVYVSYRIAEGSHRGDCHSDCEYPLAQILRRNVSVSYGCHGHDAEVERVELRNWRNVHIRTIGARPLSAGPSPRKASMGLRLSQPKTKGTRKNALLPVWCIQAW